MAPGRPSRYLLSVVAMLVAAAPASARSAATLIALDKISAPDQTVRLEARLVTGGLSFVQRPIGGERIEFLLEDRSLGETLTGGDGLAVKIFRPPRAGLWTVTARLVESPRYEAEPTELIVATRPRAHPILLVHLSSLRTPSRPPAVPFMAKPTAEAMPDAVQVLSDLSRRYQLLYLESGGEALISETKAWLANHSFPPAPLFLWPLPTQGAFRTEQVYERVLELKEEGWFNLTAGISRSVSDVEGLRRGEIGAVLIAEEDEDPELPPGAKRVIKWREVPSVLRGR